MCPTRAVFILCLTISFSATCWFGEEGGEAGLLNAVCTSECAQKSEGVIRRFGCAALCGGIGLLCGWLVRKSSPSRVRSYALGKPPLHKSRWRADRLHLTAAIRVYSLTRFLGHSNRDSAQYAIVASATAVVATSVFAAVGVAATVRQLVGALPTFAPSQPRMSGTLTSQISGPVDQRDRAKRRHSPVGIHRQWPRTSSVPFRAVCARVAPRRRCVRRHRQAKHECRVA